MTTGPDQTPTTGPDEATVAGPNETPTTGPEEGETAGPRPPRAKPAPSIGREDIVEDKTTPPGPPAKPRRRPMFPPVKASGPKPT